ncbi:2Fe-2S iron-sulfur cluster-binding protein [Natrinema salsiterrestre]|uniref:2Fe-2S iron-sulfur cluster-binding protein n=1 Tax=Natrinema salsiterrestre TaxID=2950540 RepID=A0A9Q4Q1F9_9EURY|nr:2Fe-2S iron-sulfur cluster-binding protein [Natrinema salsiterrestre]MDF9747209.1 2Fe-2S iron-sulfur cluster-binding protein [Natrinema salsiterrestre]
MSGGSNGRSRAYDATLEWPDGRTRTLAVRDDETVLEAAERAGIALPYGCLTGACGTCTGRLLAADEGGTDGDEEPEALEVDDAFSYRRRPLALKDRHRADGYVLLCIASPRVDCRIAVGSSVQSELVENPWK